jgi:tetratricopeptide (TPR) repeat protein
MQTLRFLFIAVMISACLACAGTPPKESPQNIRTGTRFLNKGILLYNRGCYQRALEHFNESHERFTAADNLTGIASSLHSIANLYFQMEDVDSALLVYDDAIEIYRQLNDAPGMARARTNKAAALIKAGRLDDAAIALDAAEPQARTSTTLLALHANTKALLHIARKDFSAANDLLARTIDKLEADPSSETGGLFYTLGYLKLTAEEPAEAQTYFNKALTLDRTAGAYGAIAKDLASLGRCQARLGHDQEAVDSFKRSAKIFALLENPRKVQEVMGELEQSAIRSNTDIQATRHWINQWLAGKTEANLCR